MKQPGQEYSPELVPCAMCGVLEFKGRPPHGLDFCRAAIAGKPGPLAMTEDAKRRPLEESMP